MTTEAAQGTSYSKLVEYRQDRIADHHPAGSERLKDLVSTVGGNASVTLSGPNLSDRSSVTLKPQGRAAGERD